MSEHIQILPMNRGAEDLGVFLKRFLQEIADGLGISYDQLVEDARNQYRSHVPVTNEGVGG